MVTLPLKSVAGVYVTFCPSSVPIAAVPCASVIVPNVIVNFSVPSTSEILSDKSIVMAISSSVSPTTLSAVGISLTGVTSIVIVASALTLPAFSPIPVSVAVYVNVSASEPVPDQFSSG